MTSPRTLVALAAGKLTRTALRTLGRGGTSLPGLVALAVDGNVAGELARTLARGVACVTGTNGKTTTSRMLAGIVGEAGWSVVHNRAGANLDRGIAGALVEHAGWGGTLRGDVGVFEIDEASVPRVLATIEPRVLVLTNLFRDQLDRYHEVDALARRLGKAVSMLPPSTILVANADDPLVARVADDHRGTLVFFGVDDPSIGGTETQSISDVTRCPRCSAPLAYRRVVLAHVGDWACTACEFARPRRDVAARAVTLGPDSISLEVGEARFRVPLAGTYNAYNALAALAAARALGIADAVSQRALAGVRPAFGRQESIDAAGRNLRLVLVKNPAGFDAAIAALLETPGQRRLLIALNDRDADGRDVSWIWDAAFERLAPATEHVVVSGLRAHDMALRLKYAGLARERVTVVEGSGHALDAAIAIAPPGGEIVVLATYTAMLSLRAELARRGHVAEFWAD